MLRTLARGLALAGMLLGAGGQITGCSGRSPAPLPTPTTSGPVIEPGFPIEPLAIGDAAPPIDVAHWLTPPPPSRALEPAGIVVVVFVASWCPHCRAVVPELNRLQRAHAGQDVAIMAVTHEPPADAREFVEAPDGFAPEFPVGSDPDLSTHAGYFDAVRESGVPTAFLVGPTGRLEWYGHPEILEEPLRQVMEGVWDREASADRIARLGPLTDLVDAILDRFDADRPAAVQAYRDLVGRHASQADELNEIVWALLAASENVRIDANPEVGELFAVATAALDESLRLAPDDGNALDTLAHLQTKRGDLAAALATQRRAMANPGLHGPRIRAYLAELEARAAEESDLPP